MPSEKSLICVHVCADSFIGVQAWNQFLHMGSCLGPTPSYGYMSVSRESKGDRCNVDHITHRLQIGLEKMGLLALYSYAQYALAVRRVVLLSTSATSILFQVPLEFSCPLSLRVPFKGDGRASPTLQPEHTS